MRKCAFKREEIFERKDKVALIKSSRRNKMLYDELNVISFNSDNDDDNDFYTKNK